MVGLERRLVAQHRPQDIDPAPGESDHCLMVPLALAPLAVVEGSRLGILEARERGLVADPFEDLVAALLRRWLPVRLPESRATGVSPA